jgi:hypothetical protein
VRLTSRPVGHLPFSKKLFGRHVEEVILSGREERLGRRLLSRRAHDLGSVIASTHNQFHRECNVVTRLASTTSLDEFGLEDGGCGFHALSIPPQTEKLLVTRPVFAEITYTPRSGRIRQ